MAHNEFIRRGDAYVGVSVEAVGVNNLKTTPAVRDSGASGRQLLLRHLHPGRRTCATGADVLGGSIAAHHRDRRVAVRVSSRHVHQRDPSARLRVRRLHGAQPLRRWRAAHSDSAPRRDRPVARTDPRRPGRPGDGRRGRGRRDGSNLGARQPDTARFREWELAGTSHADGYTISVGFSDIGDGRGGTQMLGRCAPEGRGCTRSTRAAHHWPLQAAFVGLETWVRTGMAPPSRHRSWRPPPRPSSWCATRTATPSAGSALRRSTRRSRRSTRTSPEPGSPPVRQHDAVHAPQLAALYPMHQDFVTKWAASIYATPSTDSCSPKTCPSSRTRPRRDRPQPRSPGPASVG